MKNDSRCKNQLVLGLRRSLTKCLPSLCLRFNLAPCLFPGYLFKLKVVLCFDRLFHFKATFPAVHFDARKSQRAGAFSSAAGKDFPYRTHTGMFERCQLHPAPAHYIGVEENSSARGFLVQSSPSMFFQNYAQQS